MYHRVLKGVRDENSTGMVRISGKYSRVFVSDLRDPTKLPGGISKESDTLRYKTCQNKYRWNSENEETQTRILPGITGTVNLTVHL